MHNLIFDYSNGNFIHPISGNMGIDSAGHHHMRMGSNMSMDMKTGELHFISSWEDINIYTPKQHFRFDWDNDDDDDDF